MGDWKEIPVTADVAIEVTGRDFKDLLKTAFEGMVCLMFGSMGNKNDVEIQFTVNGNDREEMIVNFLSELLFYIEIKKIVPSEVDIENLDQKSIKARLTGEKFNSSMHTITQEIKAPTYHNLKVEDKEDYLRVKIIFDV